MPTRPVTPFIERSIGPTAYRYELPMKGMPVVKAWCVVVVVVVVDDGGGGGGGVCVCVPS